MISKICLEEPKQFIGIKLDSDYNTYWGSEGHFYHLYLSFKLTYWVSDALWGTNEYRGNITHFAMCWDDMRCSSKVLEGSLVVSVHFFTWNDEIYLVERANVEHICWKIISNQRQSFGAWGGTPNHPKLANRIVRASKALVELSLFVDT